MKIAAFGEILWDIYNEEQTIGGAPFNFAAHARREGADVRLISAVGKDELGQKALKECRKRGLSTESISVLDYPTGSCFVTLDKDRPSYDLSGDMAYDHIPVPDLDSFLNKNEATAFYFGSLSQRNEGSENSLRTILERYSKCFSEIFLDLNFRQSYYTDDIIDFSISQATILKVSREETGILGIPGTPQEICKALVSKYSNLKMIIITLDCDGAFVYQKNGRLTQSEKPSCNVVSTVGAGDAFSAAFLTSYLSGLPVKKSLKNAVKLSSQVCESLEAVPFYPMDDIRKWKAIYRLLNKVETEVYDCGTLCGCACCMNTGINDEMGIYLLPGEHEILKESEKDEKWLRWEKQNPDEIDFPDSWTGPVYFVNCINPPVCPRKWRPLQCRTFPLKPVISDTGVLEMIWEDDELPYKCPIIEQNLPIHDDFYKATYTVWMHLLKDKRIMDLVLSQSEK